MFVLDLERHLVAVFTAWSGCAQIYLQTRAIRRKEFEAFGSKQWSEKAGQHLNRLSGSDDTVLASEPLEILSELLEIHGIPRTPNYWLAHDFGSGRHYKTT